MTGPRTVFCELREPGSTPLLLQDIAALTLTRDLRDLRLAQRSEAYSPRLLE
jgi:hypothetical protein